MGCSSSLLSDDKDNTILFCISFRRNRPTHPRASDIASGEDSSNQCNQSLLNPLQMKNETEYEKAYMKKDSIVTVAGLSHLTGFNAVQTVVRRTTGSGTSSSSGRLGHRKSSLALTPEDECLDPTNLVSFHQFLVLFANPSKLTSNRMT